jgi:hypothetical protein
MSITCNNCGYDANAEGTEFCEACGSELQDKSSTIVEPTMEPKIPDTPKLPMGRAKLVAKQGGYPKSEFEFSGSQPAIVGRYDDTTGPVDIDLGGFPDDDTISRNHAEIYFDGIQWQIKPISTTNVTLIRKAGESRFGSKITGPEVINNGDEIAFAKLRFVFETF